MATARIPINTFKLVLNPISTPGIAIYTAPQNVSSIILSLLVANTSTTDEYITVQIQSGSVVSTLISGSIVPAGETIVPFNSRIVLEQSNKLIVSASVSTVLESSLSVLENANS